MQLLTIYHGSVNIIKKPEYGIGKTTNDYGLGFYCTENLDLAKEWACIDNETGGYANKYEINPKALKILDLTDKKYSILNWIAVLLKFRTFDANNQISMEAKDYLLENFYIDVSKYDLIIGYRADDSYFSFAKDFIDNKISVEKLDKAMKLGQLGKQVVIISRKAFNDLHFVEYENADQTIYYTMRKARDEKARIEYSYSIKNKKSVSNELFVLDIIRKGLKNGDKII